MSGFRNSYKEGVMTLELSLLMPGIISILIIVIFSGYYFHDRCVLERGAYASCLKFAEYVMNDDNDNLNSEEVVASYFDDETKNRLCGNWDLSLEIQNTDDEISIFITGNMKCLSGIFTRYLSKIIYNVNITESAGIINYEHLYK